MRIDDSIPPVLVHAADLLAQSASGFLTGAAKLEATNLGGDDWHDHFDAGVRELNDSWGPANQALKDARAAVAELGSTDPRAVAALGKIDGVITFIGHGYDYIGHVFMDLPLPLTQPFAAMAFARIGGAGRTISHALENAAASVRALAVTA
jgi:hypothetical protein